MEHPGCSFQVSARHPVLWFTRWPQCRHFFCEELGSRAIVEKNSTTFAILPMQSPVQVDTKTREIVKELQGFGVQKPQVVPGVWPIVLAQRLLNAITWPWCFIQVACFLKGLSRPETFTKNTPQLATKSSCRRLGHHRDHFRLGSSSGFVVWGFLTPSKVLIFWVTRPPLNGTWGSSEDSWGVPVGCSVKCVALCLTPQPYAARLYTCYPSTTGPCSSTWPRSPQTCISACTRAHVL